jgi:hypothetical protein
MILTTDWNNLVAFLGGANGNSQISTAQILLNTSYPNYVLSSWESTTPGRINGAKLDAAIGNYSDSTPSNPTGTTSTTGVMMGLAIAFTPVRSSVVMVQVEGQLQNNTASDGAKATLYYGTGTAPTNGAALTGTAKGQPGYIDNVPTASKRWPFGITTILTGLTLNTAIWLDLALAALTGGTASLTGLEIVVTEL